MSSPRGKAAFAGLLLASAVVAGGVGAAATAGNAGADTRVVTTASLGTIRLTVPTKQHDWGIKSVAVVGDVNRDGVDDLAVGVVNRPVLKAPAVPFTIHSCDPTYLESAQPHTDFVQVIFGGSLPATIDLSKPYPGGFRIAGSSATSNFGETLAGAGDTNGDGLSDIVIGAPGFAGEPGSAGGAYVVYGKRSSDPIDLADLGAGGFQLNGALPEGRAGSVVSGGGDVNGDGLADVLIGATWRTPAVVARLGERCLIGPSGDGFAPGTQRTVGYAIFGGAKSGVVDLGNLGSNGFQIDPSARLANGGSPAIANAGDVDGDRRADIVVGARDGAIVVFGRASTARVSSAAPGADGVVVSMPTRAPRRWDQDVPVAVSGAGDVNGDGLADFVVGSVGIDYSGRADSGGHSGHVVFGRRSRAPIDLRKLGRGGFVIEGTRRRQSAGEAVQPLGDVNGDGLGDVGDATGSAFDVIFGKRSSDPVRVDALGNDGLRMDGVDEVGGVGNFTGGPRRLFLVIGRGEVDLVPFDLPVSRPQPAGTLSFGGRRVLGLTQGLGSVWLLVPVPNRELPFVVDGDEELVYRLDPATNRIQGRPVKFVGPSRVIATAFGSVWVLVVPPNRGGPATLLRIDPQSGRTLLRAPVGREGFSVDQVPTPDTISSGLGSLWITYAATASVYRIDPESGNTVAAIKVGRYPQALTFAGGSVWVADRQDGRVRQIDPRTNRVVGAPLDVSRQPKSPFPTLGATLWMGTAPDGKVWLFDRSRDQLARLDPLTRRLTFFPPVSTTGALAVASGSTLWLSGEKVVSRIRIADGKPIGSRVEYDTNPIGAATVGGSLWTTLLDGSLVKFNPS